ncbi:hypothetical protein [Undibacterium terreum]|uniref:Big-1 domain-containing protein n=1 Tax=Undibacterium terreum TaxID=1224302 RepID=A0A916UPP7_9BURK|nr:hypothetical protein [Undibacterium terreum]GGC80753.1 hypothetical protein GCM10011396_29900 [Undibacterium terreum]
MVKQFKALMGSLLIATLAACGGGGGSAGTPVQGGGTGGTGTTANGKISVSLFDSTGAASNILSSSGLNAKAVVTDANGAVAKNIVVTFTLDNATIASVSPVSGTALTDANGVAQISLKSGTGTGAATLTASATVVGTTAITATATFSVTATTITPSAINFTSAVPADKSIVLKGAGGNGRTEAALLVFTVVDSNNVGIPNIKVNFSVPATTSVTLGATSSLTDATGKASITVNSGSTPTTVRVVATVDGTAISALSDTVTVTTGQPTQAALSIARAKSDIEGIDFDGEVNTITVSMADQFGGVVANGTQAVFTTNAGAIIGDGGTSDTSRCLTVNGQCTVSWRSQNPRASVVTVLVTSANATETLTGSTSFINSGSNALFTAIPTLAFGSNCASPQKVSFTVTDQRGYILPTGTSITIENLSGATVVPYPASIPEPVTSAPGGTSIELTVAPTACSATGTPKTINPTLVVTTPKGKRSTQQLTITYIGT